MCIFTWMQDHYQWIRLVHHRVGSVSSSLPDGRQQLKHHPSMFTHLQKSTNHQGWWSSPPCRQVSQLYLWNLVSKDNSTTQRNQSKAREGSQSKWNRLRTKDWRTAMWNKSSCWQVTAHNMEKFDAFHNGCLQKICRTFWSEKISNKELYRMTKRTSIPSIKMAGVCFQNGPGLNPRGRSEMDPSWEKKSRSTQNKLVKEVNLKWGDNTS